MCLNERVCGGGTGAGVLEMLMGSDAHSLPKSLMHRGRLKLLVGKLMVRRLNWGCPKSGTIGTAKKHHFLSCKIILPKCQGLVNRKESGNHASHPLAQAEGLPVRTRLEMAPRWPFWLGHSDGEGEPRLWGGCADSVCGPARSPCCLLSPSTAGH